MSVKNRYENEYSEMIIYRMAYDNLSYAVTTSWEVLAVLYLHKLVWTVVWLALTVGWYYDCNVTVRTEND